MSSPQTKIICLYFMLTILSCTENSADKPKRTKTTHLVEIATLSRADLGISVIRTGTLRTRREIKIFTQEEGRIAKLPYFEGDVVKKNELVARLDDKLISAQLNRAQAKRRKAAKDLKRMLDLHKRKLTSDEELAQIETELEVAQADEAVLTTRLSYTTIASPINGVVSERLTEPGNIAERYTHLLTISDPSSLVTEVTISALLLSRLTIGDSAQVQIDALGSNHFNGQIIRIHPSIDPITRRGTIEVELKPVPEGALPGQLCRVQLNTLAVSRLMIPYRALRQDPQGEYVFLVDENNRVKRTSVEVGQRVAETIEVLNGLNNGQQIVTKGFLGLKDGKNVKKVAQTGDVVAKQTTSHKSKDKHDAPTKQ
jgi:membrane fusion protein (multidrug efflux system)